MSRVERDIRHRILEVPATMPLFDRFKNSDEQPLYKNFNLDKKALIDYVFGRLTPTPNSFADLGGVWNVDAAYTCYTLDTYQITHGFLVDLHFTDSVREKDAQCEQLTLIHGNFGETAIADLLPPVDIIYLFDILVHQVKPDWDQILKIYAPRTRNFAIMNPQYPHFERTTRLMDLGVESFLENSPHKRDHPTIQAFLDHIDEEEVPGSGRTWRDSPTVWQWGITDEDLIAKMSELGFKLRYYMHCGPFRQLTNVENNAFLFQRR